MDTSNQDCGGLKRNRALTEWTEVGGVQAGPDGMTPERIATGIHQDFDGVLSLKGGGIVSCLCLCLCLCMCMCMCFVLFISVQKEWLYTSPICKEKVVFSGSFYEPVVFFLQQTIYSSLLYLCMCMQTIKELFRTKEQLSQQS